MAAVRNLGATVRCRATPALPRPLAFNVRRWSSSSASFANSPPPPGGSDKATASSSTAADASTQSSSSTPSAPPYLPRPLGIVNPPRTTPETEREKKARLLNPDKRKEERDHLMKQLNTGYYHDWSTLKHGSKLWTGPPTLVREEHARYMPDVGGMRLSDKQAVHTTDLIKDKISLVTFEGTRMAEQHAMSFAAELDTKVKNHDAFRLVRINIQENPMKSWLVSMFVASMRRSVPPHQHPTFVLSHQSLEYLRDPMGMTNKLIGYVFLVDQHFKVRWAGCGFATAQEAGSLANCTRLLLKRFEKERKGGPAP